MTLCKHDIESDWCASCKHGPAREPKLEVITSVVAGFSSSCWGCGDPIDVGDRIVLLEDDVDPGIGRARRMWVCADCVEVLT